MSLTIGVDIGGTKVWAGVVDPAGQILARARRPTPADDVTRTRDLIAEVIFELTAQYPVEAVGIGAAGWIDVGRSVVQFAPNLAWRDEPLRDFIAARCGLPTVVENDANAAAWAEFRFGAARDEHNSMIMLTIGTGIGSGIVINGGLIRGAHGIAGELGHVVVVPDGHPCGCGRRGCLEQYASGSALVRFAQTTVKDDPAAGRRLLALAGDDPDRITGLLVTAAARAGDPAAHTAFHKIGRWLGRGIADIVQVLDPAVVVIGGGVIDAGELLLDPTCAAFAESIGERGRFPVAQIRPAALGNLAGIVGAADLARNR